MTLINNKSFKYVTVLGCFYWRLTRKGKEVYPVLEDLYSDYRKIRYREADGSFRIVHIDEIVEWLLSKDVVFDIVLPRCYLIFEKIEISENSLIYIYFLNKIIILFSNSLFF